MERKKRAKSILHKLYPAAETKADATWAENAFHSVAEFIDVQPSETRLPQVASPEAYLFDPVKTVQSESVVQEEQIMTAQTTTADPTPMEEVVDAGTEQAALARKAVRNATLISTGAGLIPIPLVDVLSVGVNQVMLVRKLCTIYGMEFSTQRAKSLIAALLGGVETGLIMNSLAKVIPIVSYSSFAIPNAILSSAMTYAIGHVFIRHFEMGGTLLTFDVESMRASFAEQLEKGKLAAQKAVSRH